MAGAAGRRCTITACFRGPPRPPHRQRPNDPVFGPPQVQATHAYANWYWPAYCLDRRVPGMMDCGGHQGGEGGEAALGRGEWAGQQQAHSQERAAPPAFLVPTLWPHLIAAGIQLVVHHGGALGQGAGADGGGGGLHQHRVKCLLGELPLGRVNELQEGGGRVLWMQPGGTSRPEEAAGCTAGVNNDSPSSNMRVLGPPASMAAAATGVQQEAGQAVVRDQGVRGAC